jgi:TolB protein
VVAPDYCVEIPAWSPDGRQIAYLSHAGGVFTGLWVINVEGGQPRFVYDVSQARGVTGGVTWTPDGRKLLVWSIQKDGSPEQRRLVFADGSGLAGQMDGVPYWWQPNFWTPRAGACRVIFARDGDIYARDCDGQNGRGLTDGPALDGRPAWSPDGQQVVFQSSRDRQPTAEGWLPESLYVVDADGSNLSRLTSGNDNDVTAAWSPDGSRIAFHRSCHLATVRPDGRELSIVVSFAEVSTQPGRQLCVMVPAWSPDSRQIAFVAMPPGDDVPGPYERDLYVVNADGTGLRRLASFSTAVNAGWVSVDLAWSPDGGSLAFEFDDAGQIRRYRISANGDRDPEAIDSIPEAWFPWRWPQWDGQAPAAATSVPGQARAFAQPILAAIADRPPDFEDDFSAAGRGWGIGGEPQAGSAVQEGVVRLRVNEGSATTGNTALNRKDFVLEVQARVAEGDKATQLGVLVHTVSSEYWFRVEVTSAGNSWLVDKNVPGQQPNLANGTGFVSPFGEPTHILIVARGPRAAVYLNWMPVAYFDDPDFDTSGGTGLFCQSLGQAVCEFDNVKFWNLANVPGLP